MKPQIYSPDTLDFGSKSCMEYCKEIGIQGFQVSFPRQKRVPSSDLGGCPRHVPSTCTVLYKYDSELRRSNGTDVGHYLTMYQV